jgi:hypothetical protein
MASDGRKQLQRWQELATEAAEETDPEKLIRIVKDLCSLLDAEKKAACQFSSHSPPIAKERPQVGSDKSILKVN